MSANVQIVARSRAAGIPVEENFALVESQMPDCPAG
jgi:hypothetical protein